jgi:hypothetical protein
LIGVWTAAVVVGPVSAFGVGGASPVRDGSFEAPVVRPPDLDTVFQPGQVIDGVWSVSDNPAAVSRPAPGIISGIKGGHQQFLWLKNPPPTFAPQPATVCQTIALDPTASYDVRFWNAAFEGGARVHVLWQGIDVGSRGATSTTWVENHVPLGSAGGATSGSLCFTGSGKGWPIIDYVSVHTVPPPCATATFKARARANAAAVLC